MRLSRYYAGEKPFPLRRRFGLVRSFFSRRHFFRFLRRKMERRKTREEEALLSSLIKEAAKLRFRSGVLPGAKS
jgi:hypothetical protein